MRVAQISTWETACGIAGYTGMLRSALLAAGTDCDVVPIDRVALRYLPLAELRAAIRELGETAADADVVHIQHEFAFFSGAFDWRVSVRLFHDLLAQLRRADKPVVVTFHTEPDFHRIGHGRVGALAKSAAKRALWRGYVARSFATDAHLAAIVHSRTSRFAIVQSGIPANRVHIVRQGTPARSGASSAEERAGVKRELGLPDEAKVLAIVGFISAYKGHQTAVRALAKLPPEYHLAVVGSVHPFSEERALDDLLHQADKSNVRDRVHVTGYVTPQRMRDYLAITDICLAPYQPLPRLSSSAALTWALASGKPVIASRIPAFTELNEEYDCLELVAPNAPNELAHRITTLSADTERTAALIENGNTYCEQNDWSRSAREHVAIYERISGIPHPLHTKTSRAVRAG